MTFDISRRDFCNFAVSAAVVPAAIAQDGAYPSHPIRIIIGASAGGSADQVSRLLGERLTRAWGEPVIVDPRPGANQAIGMAAVGKAPPDGYTLFVGTTAYTLNLALKAEPGYGPNDLVPLCHLADAPVVMVVPPQLKVDTLEQFVAAARANPGKFTFGSTGVGSAPHFNGELLNVQAKIRMVHVPYKGDAAVLVDLMSGEIQAAWIGLGTALPLMKAGRLKVISVTGERRLSALPNVATSSQAGYPLMAGYFGVWGTGGTPAHIVQKLSAELVRITKSAEVAQKLEEWGFAPVAGSSDEFAAFLAQEFKRWKAASVATGITLN